MGEKSIARVKQVQETKQTELILIEIDSILAFFFLYLILASEKLGVIPDLRPSHQYWKCLLFC